jgi:hypothetical protein
MLISDWLMKDTRLKGEISGILIGWRYIMLLSDWPKKRAHMRGDISGHYIGWL